MNLESINWHCTPTIVSSIDKKDMEDISYRQVTIKTTEYSILILEGCNTRAYHTRQKIYILWTLDCAWPLNYIIYVAICSFESGRRGRGVPQSQQQDIKMNSLSTTTANQRFPHHLSTILHSFGWYTSRCMAKTVTAASDNHIIHSIVVFFYDLWPVVH